MINLTVKEYRILDAYRKAFVDQATSPEDKLLRRFQVYPEQFILEVIGINKENGLKITAQQMELLTAVGRLSFCKKVVWDYGKKNKLNDLPRGILKYASHLGITIRAGRGTGKSSSCSWLIFWFLCTHQGSSVPCLGPTQSTLSSILWSELYNWYNKRSVDGEGYNFMDPFRSEIDMMASEVRMNKSPNWHAFQRVSPRNADEGTLKGTLGGLHDDNMMILVDEASSIPNLVFDPLESTMTSRCNFIIALFNPTRHSGWAYDTHFSPKASEHFIQLHWNSEESDIVSPEYLKNLEIKYGGRDTNNYRVSVLGVPPTAEDNSLIPYTWVEDARMRYPDVKDTSDVVLGVDIARTGGDNTIVCIRKKHNVIDFRKINEFDTDAVAIAVLKIAAETRAKYICVDSIGVGAGVYDRLRKNGVIKVYPVEFNRSSRTGAYRNLRDEMWFKLRELFEKGLISIPEDNEPLRIQLSTVRFEDQLGRIKIEAKKEIKKRLGESPDYADALAISLYISDYEGVALNEEDLYDPYEKAFANMNKSSNNTSWMAT